MLTTEVEWEPIESLEPHPANPRDGDIGAIVESIRENGFYGAIIGQKKRRRIVAGEHRWRAARAARSEIIKAHALVDPKFDDADELERWKSWRSFPVDALDQVPVLWLDVDDDEAVRILLVDNRTNDLASYRDDQLAALLTDLEQGSKRQLAGTGFDRSSLDDLLDRLNGPTAPPQHAPNVEIVPAPPEKPITKRGELWRVGRHSVFCGDARSEHDVDRLLGVQGVNLAFTSPPYAEQRDYDAGSGFEPIPAEKYVEWFKPVADLVAYRLTDDGSWFVNLKPTSHGLDTDLYVFELVLAHVRKWGWHFATEFCWERIGIPGEVTRRFKNQFEPIYQFTRGEWKIRPDAVRHASRNVPPAYGSTNANSDRAFLRLTKGGTQTPNAQGGTEEGLAYPGNRLPTFAGTHEALGHSAPFPVGLPAFFVRAFTDPDDVVYDPFLGSGSTLVAAHQTDRVGYGMELSPRYCDVALARLQRVTEELPVLDGTTDGVDFCGRFGL